MNSIAKKLKKLFISFACLFAFTSMMTFVNAAVKQKTKTGYAYTSLATATVYCTGTHYSTGNTRWAASGSVSSSQPHNSVNFVKTYISDSTLRVRADVTVTTVGYQSASASTNFTFTYANGEVS